MTKWPWSYLFAAWAGYDLAKWIETQQPWWGATGALMCVTVWVSWKQEHKP